MTCSVTNKTDIIGIGFDATCSLVVLDENFKPVTVNNENGNIFFPSADIIFQ